MNPCVWVSKVDITPVLWVRKVESTYMGKQSGWNPIPIYMVK